MTLFKRHQVVKPSADDIAFSARLYAQLQETIATYRRVLARHATGADPDAISAEALGWARAGAQLFVSAEVAMQDPTEPLLATLPQDIAEGCSRATLALERVCFALSALAEQEVVEDALLGDEELDGLIDFYELEDWLAINRDGIRGAVANGHDPPDPLVGPEITDVPYLRGGRTLLREILLNREVPDLEALANEPDAPPGGPLPEGFYWAGVHLATLVLTIHHGALYLDLLRAYDDEGPSAEIDAAAIPAAVDIAAVQQTSWRRPEMVFGLFDTPLDPRPTIAWLDDLFCSFLLLTTREPDRRIVHLDADLVASRLRATEFLDWVEAAGYDRNLPAVGVAAVREAREAVTDDDDLVTLTIDKIDGAQIPASD